MLDRLSSRLTATEGLGLSIEDQVVVFCRAEQGTCRSEQTKEEIPNSGQGSWQQPSHPLSHLHTCSMIKVGLVAESCRDTSHF